MHRTGQVLRWAVAFSATLAPAYPQGRDVEEVPPPLLAKIVRILANRVGAQGRIACTERVMAAELARLGMTIDPESMVAWGGSLAEVKALRPTRKLILCGRMDLLPPGGCIAIVVEDDRPTIYLHMRHLGDGKVLIPPDLYEISRRISR